MVRLQGIIIIAFVPDSIDIRHLRIQIADAIRRSANPYNSGFIHTNIGYRITTQAFVIIPVIHIMVQKFSGSDIHAKNTCTVGSHQQQIILCPCKRTDRYMRNPVIQGMYLPFGTVKHKYAV